MGLWADVGDQYEGGRTEECEAYPLKDPYYQKGPKGGGEEVGNGGENKKEGTGDHKFFFWNFYKGSPNKRPEDQ
jgi:hypothetical protein